MQVMGDNLKKKKSNWNETENKRKSKCGGANFETRPSLNNNLYSI